MKIGELKKRMSKKRYYKWGQGPDGAYCLIGIYGHILVKVYTRYDAELMTKSLRGAGFTIIGVLPAADL